MCPYLFLRFFSWDIPIAIACFLDRTLRPLPDRNLPVLYSDIVFFIPGISGNTNASVLGETV